MSRFKPGQQVVCTLKKAWDKSIRGPVRNEIVTVLRHDKLRPEYIQLIEYYIDLDGIEQSFHQRSFEPLSDISELEKLLSSIPETESV